MAEPGVQGSVPRGKGEGDLRTLMLQEGPGTRRAGLAGIWMCALRNAERTFITKL